MKKYLFLSALMVLSAQSFAKKDCTTEPKEKWMKEEDFKKMAIEKGYTIKKFKIPGNCYEIYGKKDGKSIEHYFNPVDGTVVKEK